MRLVESRKGKKADKLKGKTKTEQSISLFWLDVKAPRIRNASFHFFSETKLSETGRQAEAKLEIGAGSSSTLSNADPNHIAYMYDMDTTATSLEEGASARH